MTEQDPHLSPHADPSIPTDDGRVLTDEEMEGIRAAAAEQREAERGEREKRVLFVDMAEKKEEREEKGINLAFPEENEARIPLTEQSMRANAIGLAGDVVAEVRLGSKVGEISEGPAGNGLVNVWVMRDKAGDFTIVNADAVSKYESNATGADSYFTSTFTEPLGPGQSMTLGRGKETDGGKIGMFIYNNCAGKEFGDLSREHALIGVIEDVRTGKNRLLVSDLRSEYGTSLDYGRRMPIEPLEVPGASEAEIIDAVPEHLRPENIKAEELAGWEKKLAVLNSRIEDIEAELQTRLDEIHNDKVLAEISLHKKNEARYIRDMRNSPNVPVGEGSYGDTPKQRASRYAKEERDAIKLKPAEKQRRHDELDGEIDDLKGKRSVLLADKEKLVAHIGELRDELEDFPVTEDDELHEREQAGDVLDI